MSEWFCYMFLRWKYFQYRIWHGHWFRGQHECDEIILEIYYYKITFIPSNYYHKINKKEVMLYDEWFCQRIGFFIIHLRLPGLIYGRNWWCFEMIKSYQCFLICSCVEPVNWSRMKRPLMYSLCCINGHYYFLICMILSVIYRQITFFLSKTCDPIWMLEEFKCFGHKFKTKYSYFLKFTSQQQGSVKGI